MCARFASSFSFLRARRPLRVCIPRSRKLTRAPTVRIYLDVPAGRWEARYFKIWRHSSEDATRCAGTGDKILSTSRREEENPPKKSPTNADDDDDSLRELENWRNWKMLLAWFLSESIFLLWRCKSFGGKFRKAFKHFRDAISKD